MVSHCYELGLSGSSPSLSCRVFLLLRLVAFSSYAGVHSACPQSNESSLVAADRINTSEFFQQTIFTSANSEPRVKVGLQPPSPCPSTRTLIELGIAAMHIVSFCTLNYSAHLGRRMEGETLLPFFIATCAGVAVLHQVQVQGRRCGGRRRRPRHRRHPGGRFKNLWSNV